LFLSFVSQECEQQLVLLEEHETAVRKALSDNIVVEEMEISDSGLSGGKALFFFCLLVRDRRCPASFKIKKVVT
jgi:hypothetical protein